MVYLGASRCGPKGRSVAIPQIPVLDGDIRTDVSERFEERHRDRQ